MGKLTAFYMILKMYPVMLIKSKLLASYCLDLYGSQLWNYSSIDVQSLGAKQ